MSLEEEIKLLREEIILLRKSFHYQNEKESLIVPPRENEEIIPKSNKYVTVKQLPTFYPAFKELGIRNLIFFAKTNGFHSCIRKVGKRVLINTDAFEKWIESNPITQ